MKSKITKRDVLFFILGFMALFLIEVVFDWDNHVKSFKEGMAAAKSPRIENSK